MPLLTCPDCGGAVSDRAAACPHCGRPNETAPPPSDATPARARPGTRPDWAKPEHTLVGKAYIVLSYLSAAGLVVVGGLVLVIPETLLRMRITSGEAAVAAVTCVVVAALIAALTRGVSRFANWAWWLTMIFLVLSILGYLVSILDSAETPASRAGSVLMLLLYGLWLHYFWTRRADF